MDAVSSLLLNGPPVIVINAAGEEFCVRRDLFWAAEGVLLIDLLFENGSIAEIRDGQITVSCGPHALMNLLHYAILRRRGIYSEVDFFRGPILHNGCVIVSEAQVKLPAANDMSEFLGQGAYGKVKRAEALWLRGQQVAVKLVVKEEDAYKEAACLAFLRHPSIISLYALRTGMEFGLVLELMAKGTLAEVIDNCHAYVSFFPFGGAIRMAEALAFMHARGIIHRDVKPSNRAYAEEGWNSYQIMWNVSTGYRPKMRGILLGNYAGSEASFLHNQDMPAVDVPMRELIERCWQRNPADRPSMEAVLRTLHAIVSQIDLDPRKEILPCYIRRNMVLSEQCDSYRD